ncbi:MAG: hypothetical protein D6785_04420, partial [Planctomycetota bacterium]
QILLSSPHYPYEQEDFQPWGREKIEKAIHEYLMYHPFNAQDIAQIKNLFGQSLLTPDFEESIQEFLEKYESLQEQKIDFYTFWEAVLNAFGNSQGKLLTGFKKKLEKKVDKETKERINKTLSDFVKKLADLAFLADPKRVLFLEENAAFFLNRFHHLLKECHQKYMDQKGEENLLDFYDLQKVAIKILQKRKEEIHFQVIMVDEFQDTNSLQWKLIRELGHEDTEYFIVGDEKQSIYGFRGAEIEVFEEARKELHLWNQKKGRQDQTNHSLPHNFRSLSAILDTVNLLFKPLMNLYSPFSETEPQFMALQCARQIPDPSLKGSVELLINAPEEDEKRLKAVDQRLLEANTIAIRILQAVTEGHPLSLYVVDNNSLAKPEKKYGDSSITLESLKLQYMKGLDSPPPFLRLARFSDIAILLRSRTLLPALEITLKRYNIPYSISQGMGFYQKQEIKEIAALVA